MLHSFSLTLFFITLINIHEDLLCARHLSGCWKYSSEHHKCKSWSCILVFKTILNCLIEFKLLYCPFLKNRNFTQFKQAPLNYTFKRQALRYVLAESGLISTLENWNGVGVVTLIKWWAIFPLLRRGSVPERLWENSQESIVTGDGLQRDVLRVK